MSERLYRNPGELVTLTLDGAEAFTAGVGTFELYSAATGASVIGPTPDGVSKPKPEVAAITIAAPDAPGLYRTRWINDAGEIASPEDELEVRDLSAAATASSSGALLATVDQLRKYLRSEGTVSQGARIDDELLELLLESASSRIIDAASDRTLTAAPALVENPPGSGTFEDTGPAIALEFPVHRRLKVLQVPDLRAVESITAPGRDGPLAPTDWALHHRPRELCGLWVHFAYPIYSDGSNEPIVITGRWGPAGVKLGEPLAVLPSVREACLVWAARAYHNRSARYADTVQDPAGGVSSYFRNLPPDVKLVIDSLQVPGV